MVAAGKVGGIFPQGSRFLGHVVEISLGFTQDLLVTSCAEQKILAQIVTDERVSRMNVGVESLLDAIGSELLGQNAPKCGVAVRCCRRSVQ